MGREKERRVFFAVNLEIKVSQQVNVPQEKLVSIQLSTFDRKFFPLFVFLWRVPVTRKLPDL